MAMSDDNDDHHQRKSRKHDGSDRGKSRRSSRESDRRHREEYHHKDNSRRRERGGGSRDRKTTRNQGKGHDSRSHKSKKITEDEERLYEKAQEYLEREGNGDSRRRKHHGHGKDRSKRGRSESYDSSDSGSDMSANRRDKKRHRDRNEHKASKKNSDRDRSRQKKKSKHRHRDEEKQRHKKKSGSNKTQESFKDKSSRVDPSKLVSLGNTIHEPPVDQLDPEDNYFSHNSHLRLYLYRKFGIYFEDLTSSESHDAFKEFANAFNSGKLEMAYYNSGGLLPQEALDQCQRTKHRWKFRTNKLEEQSLEFVRAGVKKQTEYNNEGRTSNRAIPPGKDVCVKVPPRKDNNTDGSRRKTPAEMAAQRQSDKQHRDRIKLANEEMYGAGKAEAGWERKREMRREKSEKLHGAAKDRESEAWGGAELDDDAIYGTGDGGVMGGRGGRGKGASYEEALAKERIFRERKQAEKAARASELLKKEEEKQKKMFEMLGLSGMKAGQKIKIAPRDDT